MSFRLFAIAALVFAGCKPNVKILDDVVVTPNEALDALQVVAKFNPAFVLDDSATLSLYDYGHSFAHKNEKGGKPAELGFYFDIGIFDEPEVSRYEPTMNLPNGEATGVAYPMVPLTSLNPVSDIFDIYAYVDAIRSTWLGTAIVFKPTKKTYIPDGVMMTQSYLPNQRGQAAVVVTAYGAVREKDGTITRAPALSVIANVAQLLEEARLKREPAPEPEL
ncbi:MAG: hypothetical protein AB7P04_15115 [Bacteriovoracia bacterium]